MTERDIFFEALEITTPEGRTAYLQGACGQDVTLRCKVEELLKEHFSNDSLLLGSALAEKRPSIVESPVEEAPAEIIGRYKLLEKIGEGGFGEVWMAEQREPVKRRVALKIIKLGMDSRQVIARFEAERQAVAMMTMRTRSSMPARRTPGASTSSWNWCAGSGSPSTAHPTKKWPKASVSALWRGEGENGE
jgi:serine/threonine protein kinase